jgi:uracil-DNA glycosylase
MPQPSPVNQLLRLSQVHDEWRDLLTVALHGVEADYLRRLLDNDDWLPGRARLLAAFRRDLRHCRYILFGESPYPRVESANGIAFHDAAANELWSDRGLGKAVNRATSLRNLIKMLLLAEGRVRESSNGRLEQQDIAAIEKRDLVRTIDELFANLHERGFLLFNATQVLYPARKPAAEARYWFAFIERLLSGLAESAPRPPTLVLWGKIAQQILAHPAAASYPRLVCEHPYNLSFVHNRDMHKLFGPLQLLRRSQ